MTFLVENEILELHLHGPANSRFGEQLKVMPRRRQSLFCLQKTLHSRLNEVFNRYVAWKSRAQVIGDTLN